MKDGGKQEDLGSVLVLIYIPIKGLAKINRDHVVE